ncbi:MAG: hypothetical protein ACR2MY_14135 [Candidatus Dormibacteria bacterium]
MLLVLFLLVAGIGLTAYFDLAGPLPMSDEWMFWFPLQSVHTGQGFQLWPGVLPLSLVQLAVALPLAAASPEIWRLTELPFLALAAICAFALGRRLGAARFWSAAAATTVVCAPVTLSVATGFTSDIAYLGLMLLGALVALRWLDGDGPLWPLLLVAALTTLQRQHGLAILPALAMALLAAGRRDRRGWLGVSLVAAVVAVALVAPFTAGVTTRTMNGLRSNSGRLGPGPSSISATLITLMPMLGVFFLPLAPALLRRPEGERGVGRIQLLPVALCSAGVAGAAGFAVLFHGTIWPGNVLGIWGLGPTHVGGYKPPLLGIPLFLCLELLSVGAFLVILGARRRQWNVRNLRPAGVFLVILGLAHLLFMPFTSPLDRYFIPVMAALAPVLAVIATRVEGSRAGGGRGASRVRAGVLLLVAGGLVLYAVGEQDYQAWQAARERAALLAYTRIDPARLEAGYEAVAHHAAVPEYLRDRRISIDPIDLRPADPVARLEFAAPSDPRPGAGYVSASPGKVVIVCVIPAPACPFAAP